MSPRVTLAMPVYNGERYFEEALRSALAQDYDDVEVLITDNASTDRTPEIIQDYAQRYPQIVYHRNKENVGSSGNWNLGIELGRGEFLKWCAHDDWVSPNFVSVTLAALDANPEASMAFGATQCIDSDGAFIPARPGVQMGAILDDDPAERLYETIVTSGSCYPLMGLFRMSVLKRGLRFQPYYGSDRPLLAETAFLGKVLRVPEAVLYNRDHAERSMNIGSKSSRRFWMSSKAGRWANSVEINQFRQMVQIATRHPDVCPPARALRKVGKAALTLKQMGLFGIDAVRFASPEAAGRLRGLVDMARGKSKNV